jgi:hypothetical protein
MNLDEEKRNMEEDSVVWFEESDPKMQLLVAWLMLLGGLFLVIGSRITAAPNSVGALSALGLGAILILVGLVQMARGGKQVITVDVRRRCIRIAEFTRFGNQARVIGFNEIAAVSVGTLGDSEGGSISYHVDLELKSGKQVSLYVGFYSGRYNHDVAEGRCRRIAQAVGCAVR